MAPVGTTSSLRTVGSLPVACKCLPSGSKRWLRKARTNCAVVLPRFCPAWPGLHKVRGAACGRCRSRLRWCLFQGAFPSVAALRGAARTPSSRDRHRSKKLERHQWEVLLNLVEGPDALGGLFCCLDSQVVEQFLALRSRSSRHFFWPASRLPEVSKGTNSSSSLCSQASWIFGSWSGWLDGSAKSSSKPRARSASAYCQASSPSPRRVTGLPSADAESDQTPGHVQNRKRHGLPKPYRM